MINLLPDDVKKEVRAARMNVILLNYVIVIGLGVTFLGLLFGGVYYVLSTAKTEAEVLIAQNNSKTTAYTSIQQQALSLKAGLSSAKLILDQEVVFSDVITGVAAAMPSGVVLSNLTLTPATFGTPLTLQAFAKTTNDALKLKDSFQKSPLFSKVSFQSLSSSAGGASGYPVSVSLSITINKGVTK